jgi:uncharacterized Fe-S cluster-containing MiaB family protein
MQKNSRIKLFQCYGIILDNLGAKGELRKEIIQKLKEAYAAETDKTIESITELNSKELLEYIKWILMILETEFGIFVETPNEQGTENMTLQEYLKYINHVRKIDTTTESKS